MSIFVGKGNLYLVNKDESESIEEFIKRGNFVAAVCPINRQEYENAVIYSRIMLNVECKGSSYNQEVMNKLSDYYKKYE